MDNTFDDQLDRKITELLSGESAEEMSDADADTREMAPAEGYEPLAAEITRVFMEESPRLAPSIQARQLAQLRARAAQKRRATASGSRWDFSWLLHAMPRWAQVAAVAIVVVLLANGITVASASSLPGSPLYPVKRLAEQSNLFLAPTAGERARVWMNLASIRLDEAQRVLAAGQRVDPALLDAVDQSIFNALAEIAGTRGAERVDLLKQITQLSIRQQQVLDGLAPKAPPTDRARFEQTSRLLGGVATLAGAAESNPSLPLAPTPPPTATGTPTATPTNTSTVPPAATWTQPPAPPVVSNPAITEPDTSSGSGTEDQAPSGPPANTPAPKEKDSPGPQGTQKPESGDSNKPAPGKTESSDQNKTESPGQNKTESPDSHQARSPDH